VRGLLLDRDGVINVDHGYVHRIDRFDFTPGIFELVRLAQDLGLRIAVVTNQAGIARGYYDEAQFLELTRWMEARFAAAGVALAGVHWCPYHLEGKGDYVRDSFWRKPNPGMLLEAAARHGLDLARSIMVGDQPTDMTAAARAGVGRRVLLTHGRDTVLAPDADTRVGTLPELAERLPGLLP